MAGATPARGRLTLAATPWQQAHAAAAAAGVRLRACDGLEDCDAILRVMIATWGAHQLLPREEIRALGLSGNVPWGAFDDDELIGYVLGWAGVDEGGLHVHSHMLAALPDRRHRGVGYALKLAQRAQALDQGIVTARWTFDPLVSRNAHFNLVKLGAVADRFRANFYGEMGDDINRGERSDRLTVRWDLEKAPGGVAEAEGFEVLGRDEHEAPTSVRVPSGGPALVRIPREYHELREKDERLGEAWRTLSRKAMEACFGAGLVATGFTRDSAYVFTEERA